jgi:hypothetical protein
VSFVEDDNAILREVLGDAFCDLGVEKIVV